MHLIFYFAGLEIAQFQFLVYNVFHMAQKELDSQKHIPIESTVKEIARGTNRRAELIDVQIVSGTRSRIQRMVRKIPHGNFSADLVEKELRAHEELKKHGIPSIPTFRRDSQNPTHGLNGKFWLLLSP